MPELLIYFSKSVSFSSSYLGSMGPFSKQWQKVNLLLGVPGPAPGFLNFTRNLSRYSDSRITLGSSHLMVAI